MTMNYKDALAWSKQYEAKLRADDVRFRQRVYLVVDDGSSFMWDSAFYVKLNTYIVIFTEHHGTHVYDNDDIYHVEMFKRVEPEIFKL